MDQCETWVTFQDFDGTFTSQRCQEEATVHLILVDERPEFHETYTVGVCAKHVDPWPEMAFHGVIGVVC